MNASSVLRNSALALALVAVCGIASAGRSPDPLANAANLVRTQAAQPLSVTVFATGLNNPRGLKFGPDGKLYVAEGGLGGTNSTAGQCDQVAAPVGPYTGRSTGGRISRIDSHGVRTTITTQLPSSQTSPDLGSLVSGAADVAFIGNTLYAMIAGGGCSHGVPSRDNAIVRIASNGTPTLVANLSTWIKAHPGTIIAPDFEPDGTWYGLVAHNGALYATEPNQGLFVRVNPSTGAVTRVLDVAGALAQHVVPTALARHGGYFYIANLGTFPITDGTQRVWRVLSNPTRLRVVAEGTAILGLAFDASDNLYILQMTTGNPMPTPGAGSIVRIRPGGGPETIVDGLTLPTAMTVGPDGALYVSHIGFGPPIPGAGQILRIALH